MTEEERKQAEIEKKLALELEKAEERMRRQKEDLQHVDPSLRDLATRITEANKKPAEEDELHIELPE